MIEVSVLASGSNGNCFFFQGNGTGFLIDAGISTKQICQRLVNIGKQIHDIKGIFLTHEHIDHVRGIQVLIKRFQIPIYLSQGTHNGLKFNIDPKVVNIISDGAVIVSNDCQIKAFKKSHDAKEPLSYTLSYNGKKASFITDLGHACDNVKTAVKESDILILESNYDSNMLDKGTYPYFLKKRISGFKGHLSNDDAGVLVKENGSSLLKQVFLSHLSAENNRPDIALNTFKSIVRKEKDLKGMNINVIERGGSSNITFAS